MATKTNPRRRAEQHRRLLAAAARRAERRGNHADASWARAQYEMRTGRCVACDLNGTYPPGVPAAPHTCVGGDAA